MAAVGADSDASAEVADGDVAAVGADSDASAEVADGDVAAVDATGMPTETCTVLLLEATSDA